MAAIDYILILIYFVVVIGLGFWYRKRAAKNLEAYFLGGKRMHWLQLSMSGSVSTFDITGTMWIVSILVLLGMKSMWHHWMWGVYMGAFFLAYMGKWVRRSNVMTAAEWMETRFGDNRSGRLARTAYALIAVLVLAGFIGYAYQGIGKFASVYLPLSELASEDSPGWIRWLVVEHETDVLAMAIFAATTLYVVLGGLYSVVVTDVIQTVILTVAALFISWLAWSELTPEVLSRIPSDWTSLAFPWKIEVSSEALATYEFFGALVIVWTLKGLLLNAGGPGQMYDFQRFLAARDSRDAAKIGAAWSLFLLVRWGMTAGIALLAIGGAMGISDTEKAMPIILREVLPVGVRGIVIAGLLAAFMSTFSSTVNGAASFLVRDLWQAVIKPEASERQLIRASYWATLLVVAVGIVIGLQATSIAEIWNWLMMALGAGVIIPNFLRWYWWRINGWGYALGTFGGILASLVVYFAPNLPSYYAFFIICAGSLLLCLVGTWVTAPVEGEILKKFYLSVRPFGAWRPVRDALEPGAQDPDDPRENFALTLLNVLLGMIAITGGYLFPMYLVGHWYGAAGSCFAMFAAAMVGLYFTWYRNLPPAGEER